jgi:methanogen homocitrate synthase
MERSEPWRRDSWWVSPFNFIEEIRKNYVIPEKVIFHDVTLRDGEQTPCIVFTKEDKVEIAKFLDEIGVQRIEGGMPVVSEEDFNAIKAMAKENLKAKIFGFARLIKSDVDAVIESEASGIICEGPVGIPKLIQYGWKEEEVFSKAATIIDYAKDHGLYTVFFGVDTTRADINFLINLLIRLSKETKVDSFVIVDTYGCTTPEGFGYLVKVIANKVRNPLEVHTHNDFGLATINTIYGLLNGAQVAHVSVNGIGERCGNAPLEEVALALHLLYGIHVEIKFEKLYELSKLVERLSGFKLAKNKPIVGEYAFTRESGIAVAGWLKYYLGSEAYLPELVGNRHNVVLGKKSGRHSIEWKLRQFNLKATSDEIIKILEEVKKLSLTKRSCVNDEEFLNIYRKLKADKDDQGR